jgi:hypothetical protein
MKIISSILFFMFSMTAWACPNCHQTVNIGAKQGPPYTLIILAVFIAVTYIPMYFFFRMTKKYATHSFDEN